MLSTVPAMSCRMGVGVVHGLEVLEHHLPLGVVVVHFDLLADDPLLFGHGLLCKVGRLYKVQQDLQRLVEMVGAGEEIAGGLEGGVGVGAGPGASVPGKGVPVLALEELVLQIVGDAFRHLLRRRLVAALEAVVHRAVPGAEYGVGGAAPLLGVEENLQPGGMTAVVVVIPHAAAGHAFQFHLSTPLPSGGRPPRAPACGRPPPRLPRCRT